MCVCLRAYPGGAEAWSRARVVRPSPLQAEGRDRSVAHDAPRLLTCLSAAACARAAAASAAPPSFPMPSPSADLGELPTDVLRAELDGWFTTLRSGICDDIDWVTRAAIREDARERAELRVRPGPS